MRVSTRAAVRGAVLISTVCGLGLSGVGGAHAALLSTTTTSITSTTTAVTPTAPAAAPCAAGEVETYKDSTRICLVADAYVQQNHYLAPSLLVVSTGSTGGDEVLSGPAEDGYGPAEFHVVSTSNGQYGCASAGSTQAVYHTENAVQRELPTVYTNSAETGVCGGDADLSVSRPVDWADGTAPVVSGQTGQDAVDDLFWEYGEAGVYVTGGPESPNEPCAPEGSTTAGHSNGNNISRELPTVYTNNNETGACGGDDYFEVNRLADVVNGDAELVETTAEVPPTG